MGDVVASDLVKKVKESYPDEVILKLRYGFKFTRQKSKRIVLSAETTCTKAL